METTVKLKLFVDTRAEKVIFAEAGKDFIDFLVYFLSLPVGTVARLLKGKGTVGSLSNLYKSVENLSESFFQPNQTKNSLLNPRAPRSAATGVPLLLCDYDSHTRMVYSCPSHYHNITDVPNLLCPSCNKKMTGPLYYVPPSLENTGLVEGGFVKSFVSFMVTDDLEFMPISPENLFSLLNKSNVEIDELEKMDVELGADEGLRLLKLSLECEKVLTSLYQGTVQQTPHRRETLMEPEASWRSYHSRKASMELQAPQHLYHSREPLMHSIPPCAQSEPY
ncbi:uncharacterized protein LOC116146992 [Pistacia vera]|uniref:uncharacterized protein LOC116146992 n=1 Tax=Pistacia vera TaxID=55513 RepID=UPI001263A142|nr:uncharacterized protein LOC116146992 [Pistacia vera]